MIRTWRYQRGYTLVEVLVSSAILVTVVATSMSVMVHNLRIQQRLQIQTELDIHLEKAVSSMRRDLRLSSAGMDNMVFYPANAAEFTALSMPLADDLDGDGQLDRHADGSMAWAHTVIYHIAPGDPDRLRRTVFSPRNADATAAERYIQLLYTVHFGDASYYVNAQLPGETVSSDVVFANLVNLKFMPLPSYFDCYSPTVTSSGPYNAGSVVLQSGTRQLEITVKEKNADSLGYRVQVDRLSLSLAGTSLEAELFDPEYAHPTSPYFHCQKTSGTLTTQSGADWKGGAALSMVPTTIPATFSFDVYSDLFCDTSFNEPAAAIHSNCSAKIDLSFESVAPYISERLVSMDKGIAWSASSMGLATNSLLTLAELPVAVTLFGAGETNTSAVITRNGRWARFTFERDPTNDLVVTDVVLEDIEAGTSEAVTFSGNNGFRLADDDEEAESITSDWVRNWEIDRSRNYRLSFVIAPDGTTNGVPQWVAGDTLDHATIGGVAANLIPALSSMEVGYPDTAIYRSQPIDTQTANPYYRYLTWTQQEYFDEGGDIDIRIRASDSPVMAGARWTDASGSDSGYFPSNVPNSISALPRGRYFQYEARLSCGHDGGVPSAHIEVTPLLQDVTVEWARPSTLVDVIVELGMGPDCGMVEFSVDGKDVVKAFEAEIEIYKDSRTGRETAAGKIEINPRNTGL